MGVRGLDLLCFVPPIVELGDSTKRSFCSILLVLHTAAHLYVRIFQLCDDSDERSVEVVMH